MYIQCRRTNTYIDSAYFYDDLSVYADFGGTVLKKEEGIKLANALGPKNKSIILQNHGYVRTLEITWWMRLIQLHN